MRRVIRLASSLALGLALLTSGACEKQVTGPGGTPPGADAHDEPEVQLPDPLPLPAEPAAASWVEQPQQALALLTPYSPVEIDVPAMIEQALLGLTEPGLASALAQAIDLKAPFANVVLDDQEIIRVSLHDEGRKQLSERFAQLEAVGDFGAVAMPSRPEAREGSREWLAWIDEADGGVLVLGNSLEGLVTARQLGPTYGEQPLYFTADLSELPIPVELPFARVSGRGNLDLVVVEARALAGQDPLAEFPIAAGTLAGLLGADDIVAGVSTRYADHKEAIREVTGRVNAEVRELPFLVRGIGEDLAAKLGSTLRTWDGRVLAAVGPRQHVRVAYGANDVAKSRVATIRLLQTVVDNVSIARKFVSLPKMTLRRRVAKGGGQDVEMLVISDAHTVLPAELRPLIDEQRRLNVAMAWSERAGGGMIMVGPQADKQLAAWLDQSAEAPDHRESTDQLVAASFAGDPVQLQALLTSDSFDPTTFFSLDANGPKWEIEVVQRDDLYLIQLRTPGTPKPARAAH